MSFGDVVREGGGYENGVGCKIRKGKVICLWIRRSRFFVVIYFYMKNVYCLLVVEVVGRSI